MELVTEFDAGHGEPRFYVVTKRAIDLVVTLVTLIPIAPFLVLIGLVVRITSRGPALYRAPRVGKDGRDYLMYKFRSMIVDADSKGGSSTSADDPRITRFGRLMRRYKLDELPQLLNVLRGDMSLVGPRPQIRWAVELYSPEERLVLSVPPGITDYASLKYRNEAEILLGSHDPDRDYLEKIAPGKMRLGLAYVRQKSILVDLRILLATALMAFGVSPDWCLPVSERAGLV